MEFAEKYKFYDNEDWSNVIWSDETKINRFGSDGRQWTWKKRKETLKEQHVTSTLKFGGGSIMIWGCMMTTGVGMIQKIEERMTAKDYINILKRKLTSSIDKWGKTIEDVEFQQDNDPKHAAKN